MTGARFASHANGNFSHVHNLRGALVVDNDAMRLLDASRYEVVPLDWQLPDGNGGQVVSHLRRYGATRPERVMIMTATGPNDLPKIDRTLVRGVLFKPLDYSALTAHAMLS